MQKKVKYIKNLKRAFFVSWVLTNRCNFHCKNCITAHQAENPELTPEQIEQGAINLAKKINTLNPKKCHTRFLGGEPTLIPDLTEKIIKFHETLNAKNISCCIQTNLSQSAEFYAEMLEKLYSSCKDKNVVYSVQTSFYPDFSNFNEYLSKLKILRENFGEKLLLVKFVADDSNYDEINSYYEKIKAEGFSVDFYPNMANLYNLKGSTDFDNSNLDKTTLLKEQPTKTFKKGQSLEVKFEDDSILYFKNYNQFMIYQGIDNVIFEKNYCSAGFNSIRVEADGSVYRSAAACIKEEKSRLGSITDGFEFYNNIEKCTTSLCCNCFDRLYTGIDYPDFMDRKYLNKYIYPDFSSKIKTFLYKIKQFKIFHILSK